jgi:transposase InsO family protein
VAIACIYGCLRFVVGLLMLGVKGDADREVELLLLRHELSVLRRSVKKPRLYPADRMIVAALAMRLPRRAWTGLLVRPETVLSWHRALVRRKWAAFGRRRGPGRPRIDQECRQLILRLARENPRWGYIRIRGELLKLGHLVSTTSVRNLMQKHCGPNCRRRSGLSWREFIRAQASAIVATDYFTVDTWNLKRLYILFFMELGTRRVLWFGVTENPNQEWVTQQARNLTWELQERASQAKFLICDNDKKFPYAFEHVLAAEGVRVIRTPLQAPKANAYAERWVGSARRECLDWLIIRDQRHLERVLDEYIDHYNNERPHRGLQLQPPNGHLHSPAARGAINCRARLGGLLREYSRGPSLVAV